MPMQSPTLRDMIQAAIDGGSSLRELQERAIDPSTGESVGKDTISKIRRGEMNRVPMEHHLRAIAAALRIPYADVRQAAINEWLPPETSESGIDERAELRAEALRLRKIGEEALARADAVLSRASRATDTSDGGRAESA